MPKCIPAFSFTLTIPKPSLLTMLRLKPPHVNQQFVHSSALAQMWLSYLAQTRKSLALVCKWKFYLFNSPATSLRKTSCITTVKRCSSFSDIKALIPLCLQLLLSEYMFGASLQLRQSRAEQHKQVIFSLEVRPGDFANLYGL